MIKFIEYNPFDENGGCILRAFHKLFDINELVIKDELIYIAKKYNLDDYREVVVFEEYLFNKGYEKISYDYDTKIKDLELNSSKYCVFCYDKNNFYHMTSIVDGCVFDKSNCLDLYVINIYKEKDK